MSGGWIAVLSAVLIAVGCGGRPRSATPGPTAGVEVYREAARARLARDGLKPGRTLVVSGAAWRAAAHGTVSLVEALDRAGLPGITIEPRGRSVCARSAPGPDCMFVSIIGSDEAPHEVDAARLEAVVVIEPAPPDEPDTRMAWREELRTGRLLLFVGAHRRRTHGLAGRVGSAARPGVGRGAPGLPRGPNP